MEGVEHGTELAGRYRLEERLRTTSAGESWRAVDTTLDRPVAVRLVPHDTADDVLDAARRAAVVEDPALLRVLDVAQEPRADGPLTYVVSEHVDAVPLADLLRRGPLPADQVRAVVGRTATALAAASAAGLHHEVLTPEHVLCLPDGGVKVEGLAVEAAARGGGAVTADEAARADAVALVALLHAGLTATWPMEPVAGLEATPLDGEVPVPPADLVDGVPNDLDTLCAVTLGDVDDGPRTPQEVVEQLRPWDTGLRPTPVAAGLRPAGRFPRRTGSGAAAGA
ncbi:protein kinase family protein, partial [Angustibacter speluncae]